MTNFVGRLGVTLGLDAAEFTRGIESASRKLEQFSDAVGTYGKVAAAALTAASVAALRYADEIADTAQATDVAIASILQLSNALANNGGKADSASKLVSTFTAAIDKAAEGSFETQKVLQSLGVSFKDLGTLSVDELLRKTVAGLAEMSDSLTRNAKARELFGKAALGVDFVGLNQEMRTANRIADEQAKKIKDAADAYDSLAQITREFTTILASELGPPLKATIDYIKSIKSETNLMGAAFKTVFQTVAVLGANVAFVFEAIADEMVHTITNAKLLATFDFKAARAANEAHWAKWEQRRKELDAFEKKIMGGDAGGGAAAATEARQADANKVGSQIRKTIQGVDKVAEEAAKKEIETQRRVMALREQDRERQARELQELLDYQQKNKENLEREQVFVAQRQAQDLERQQRERQEFAEYKSSQQMEELALVNQQAAADELLRRERIMLELTEKARFMRGQDVQLAQEVLAIQFKYADAVKEINQRQNIGAEARQKALQEQLYLSQQEMDLAQQRYELANRVRTGTFVQGFEESLIQSVDNAITAFKAGQQTFDALMGNMESALMRFVQTGKLSFKDLARSIITDIIAIQMRAQISRLFGAIGSIGVPQNMGPNLVNQELGPSFNRYLTGALPQAEGGPVSGGLPYMVGERGPELFVPRGNGAIVPTNQLAGVMGGGQTINYNGPFIQQMSAIDTQSGMEFLVRNKQAVWAANQSAQRSLPMSR